jgi:hypothetical protein
MPAFSSLFFPLLLYTILYYLVKMSINHCYQYYLWIISMLSYSYVITLCRAEIGEAYTKDNVATVKAKHTELCQSMNRVW